MVAVALTAAPRGLGVELRDLLWFLLVLVPSSALIALDQGEPMAEHRVYLASCGMFLAAGSAIGWLGERLTASVDGDHGRRTRLGWRRRRWRSFCCRSASGRCVRNAVWRDPVTLWRESVDLAPAHYRPRLLLGEALQDAGRRDEAMEQYQTAIRLRPTDADRLREARTVPRRDRDSLRRPASSFSRPSMSSPRDVSAQHSLTILAEMETRLQLQ